MTDDKKLKELEELKSKLSEELNKEEPDASTLLALSSEIAELDEKKVRFTVDAGHVNRLGLELVSRRETALSELIKNSYDADAHKVDVVFNHEKNTLTLFDDGLGMTREELINGFMRLSTNMKSVNNLSSLYKRYRAGRKGIGRFAAQRLGKKLKVVTKTKDSDSALAVTIDWDNFKPGTDLITVASEIEVLRHSEHDIKLKGTKLIISELREQWSDAQIRRVYRYASDILLPYPIAEPKTDSQDDDSNQDPGFSATFWNEENDDINIVADADSMYLNHSLAVIEGKIDAKGIAYWRLKSDKYNYDSGKNSYVTRTFQDYKQKGTNNEKRFPRFN